MLKLPAVSIGFSHRTIAWRHLSDKSSAPLGSHAASDQASYSSDQTAMLKKSLLRTSDAKIGGGFGSTAPTIKI